MGRRRSAAWVWSGALGLALASACSLSTRHAPERAPAPLETGVRLWIPTLVWWDAGRGRHLDVAIENGTPSTVALAEPDPAYARVAVFARGDGVSLCAVEPRAGNGTARRAIELPPGGSVSLRVELDAACAGVPPGAYRFEVEYRSPELQGRDGFSGALATHHGELLVEGAPKDADPPARRRAARTPPRR